MSWIVQNLWLIPALPMLAAGLIALCKRSQRRPAAALAIGSMSASLVLSLTAFFHTLHHLGTIQSARETFNFTWFTFGDQAFRIGWLLDPLTAVMLVMVTFVGLLIFIYSVGYMAHDDNFTRFFCFLALFAGAMLGVVIANNLLLLFMCWEIVGLTSYLLIGFWFFKPSAAAAAKKAFLVTRIGDMGLFLGILYLYAQSGTLLFYDGGHGALEATALATMATHAAMYGMAASTAISLLIFCGAAGKSGQVPLHVWLPDAMEGPTPVSALIHAATMVAAGVFLMARIYPLITATPLSAIAAHLGDALHPNAALQVITWVGAITALYAAIIAVAQWDIKRILAYSTVSQLGYMMMGLGVGGPAVGIFHLITHAFFKSLLFMGAGSVIHGCSGEQHVARMGGLRRFMPITFATYAIGMLALSGFPIFFSGFWSKDAILHAGRMWPLSLGPYILGSIGALLTAFYMTRQMYYVFAGELRLRAPETEAHPELDHSHEDPRAHEAHAHESPATMTTPLVLLAACTLVLGYFGTPAWPWFQSFLNGQHAHIDFAGFFEPGLLPVMISSSLIAILGLFVGWLLYGRHRLNGDNDPLQNSQPGLFAFLHNAFHIDAFYSKTIVRLNTALAHIANFADRFLFNGIVRLVSGFVLAVAYIDRFFDTLVINPGFDAGTGAVSLSGRILSLFQTGRAQTYLRFIGLALIALVVLLLWGAR